MWAHVAFHSQCTNAWNLGFWEQPCLSCPNLWAASLGRNQARLGFLLCSQPVSRLMASLPQSLERAWSLSQERMPKQSPLGPGCFL